jgi:hypothetical protein
MNVESHYNESQHEEALSLEWSPYPPKSLLTKYGREDRRRKTSMRSSRDKAKQQNVVVKP